MNTDSPPSPSFLPSSSSSSSSHSLGSGDGSHSIHSFRSSCSSPQSGNPDILVYRHAPPHSPWRYSQLDALQRRIAAQVRQGEPGALILSELAPVVTLGRRVDPSHLIQPQASFVEQGVEVYPTDRGGFATYHGPGQWVLFPVLSLERLTGDPRGVSPLVECLLQIALEVGLHYQSALEVRSGKEQGVWTPRGKFAAVGVHIQEGVILHGLSLNGFRTHQSFQGIRPCGLEAPVSFLLDQPDDPEFLKLGQTLLKVAQKVLLQAYALRE